MMASDSSMITVSQIRTTVSDTDAIRPQSGENIIGMVTCAPPMVCSVLSTVDTRAISLLNGLLRVVSKSPVAAFQMYICLSDAETT